MRLSNTTKGILCLVTSAFGFAVMGLFVRLADNYGECIPAFQKSFFRNVVAFILAAVLFFRAGSKISFWGIGSKKTSFMVLVLRSVLGTLGIFGNFYALSKIPLSDAMMLNKTAPFFTVFFSWLFLHDKISGRQIFALVGAFTGALLVIKPGTMVLPILPALCGLSSGLCAGAAYTCVRELGLLKVDARFIVLFFSGFSCLASLPFLIFDYHIMTVAQIVMLIGAGVGASVGQFGITAAYRFAPPRRIAVFDYSNIIFAGILGFIFLQQIPDALSIIGFVIILLMSLTIR